MSDLTVRDNYLAISQRVTAGLTASIEQMQLHRGAAMAAAEELSRIYSYGSFEAARTMATVEMIRHGRIGTASQVEEAAYSWYDQQYLSQMGQVMQQAGEQIIQQLREVNLPASAPRGFLDELLGR